MNVLQKESPRGAAYVRLYAKAVADSVRSFYKRPSSKKIAEERILLNLIADNGGRGYKVLSGNSFTFVAGWIARDGALRIETARNSYIIK